MYMIEDPSGNLSHDLTEAGVGAYLGFMGMDRENYISIRTAMNYALNNPGVPVEIRPTGYKIISLDPAVESFLRGSEPLDPNFYKPKTVKRRRSKSKSPRKKRRVTKKK